VPRVVDAAEDTLARHLLQRTRSILVEHRPPALVVADVDARDDEPRHLTTRFALETPTLSAP
jgi:hypothetical protein